MLWGLPLSHTAILECCKIPHHNQNHHHHRHHGVVCSQCSIKVLLLFPRNPSVSAFSLTAWLSPQRQEVEMLAFITQSINSVIYQSCQSEWLITGCQGGEWHIRKVWLTMPVAGARLLPPSPVINVLSACNPTPTLNEARIYHLGRVADVRGKGNQVARNNILFLACARHVWQALKTQRRSE